jgi:hypothetical protein
MDAPETNIDLLKKWHHRVRLNQRGHYAMEERCDRRDYWYGVIPAILSGIIAILVLLAVSYNPPTALRIFTASLSIITAALATIRTYGKWSEKATQHHAAGAEYGKLLRKIEETLAAPPSEDIMQRTIKRIREKLDLIPNEAPPVLDKVWKRLSPELTPSLEIKQLGAERNQGELTA